MNLTRVAVWMTYLYLSLALSVALSEKPEHHALAEQMGVTWSFVRITATQEDRRSLRNVHASSPHLSPSLSESSSRTGGGLGVGAIIGIVVSSLCFILVVAVAVVWGCRRMKTDPEWGLLGSFKRRSPDQTTVADEEKLYAQAKGDTHLSGF